MRDAATEPTPGPTGKTYAEVAVQPSTTSSALRMEGKGKAKAEVALGPAPIKAAQANVSGRDRPQPCARLVPAHKNGRQKSQSSPIGLVLEINHADT